MNTSTLQDRRKTAVLDKRRVALALAAAVSVLALGSAYGADGGRRDEHQTRQAPHRADAHRDRDRHGYTNGNYYPQPLYVAPVVGVVPVQSPGINLFVPLDIHLR
jgi:hypothetical protein